VRLPRTPRPRSREDSTVVGEEFACPDQVLSVVARAWPPIVASTRSYEKWLAARTDVVTSDLQRKHDEIRKDAFRFHRATYYRWAEVFPFVCRNVAKAPRVLAIGDLHVENFG